MRRLALVIAATACLSLGFAASPAEARPHRAGPQRIWVPAHVMADGAVVPGHFRARHRPGYIWVEAHVLRGGTIMPGYWQPLRPRRGMVWVPGHVSPRGQWVAGFWRPVSRPGHRWLAGHYHGGRFLKGAWLREERRERERRAAHRAERRQERREDRRAERRQERGERYARR